MLFRSFPIHIPALRNRREDIPLLMDTFFRRYCSRHQRQLTGFVSEAVDALMTHSWPGNIRELENRVERAVILAQDGGSIHIEHLFQHLTAHQIEPLVATADAPTKPSRDMAAPSSLFIGRGVTLDNTINEVIDRTLRETGGNGSAAARALGITRARLEYRLSKRKDSANY